MANRFGAAAAIPWMRIPQASGGHYGMPDPRVVSGVTLWMDAADSSTITQSANEVSQWNSKVGGRNFSQAGAGLKPLTNTVTKNGLNVLDFDGVNDVMNCSVTNATLYTAAALTVFLVANADTVDATYRGFYGDDSALVIDAQSTDRIRVGHADAGGFDVLSGIPITAGTWFILRARHDGGNIRRAINAAAYTSLASANTALLTTTSRVGQANSAGYLDGQIAELIVTNNLLSTADEEGLLYYLNQKWAIY
jgi:hypothetical protein